MKRTSWLVAGLTVAVLPIALGAALAAPAEPIKGPELDQVRRAVEGAGPVSMMVVAEDFTGPISDAKKFSDQLLAHVQEQGIGKRLGSQTPEGILILNEDPTGKAQVPMTIGLSIRGRVDVKPPLKIMQVRIPKAACHTHAGPYAELGSVHSAIKEEVQKRGRAKGKRASTDWPVVIKLLGDPRKGAQIKSEMCVPIKEG